MLNPVDISPIAPAAQNQSAFDLFLIFVGANIVATTVQVGASLASSFSVRDAVDIVVFGSIAGAMLVAVLAPIGSRLRIPSVIAARPALGVRGAGLLAALLYVSNFAWIALNNVIAASACVQAAGGRQGVWAVGLGVLATIVVWSGPRAVALADRAAVPLMLVLGVALTLACVKAPRGATPPPTNELRWSGGLDVVIGYQVSWILMFADYSRYTRSARGSGIAVFAALAATSVWMMPLGLLSARAAGSSDPGAMMAAVGLGASGALLLTLATVTTNFVNIYISSLAWKTLAPRTGEAAVVWSVGLVGAGLSAVPRVWLDQYVELMMLLAAALVPVGGVLMAHYYLATGPRRNFAIDELYELRGQFRGFSAGGMVAWVAGAATFYLARPIGGTLPALIVSVAAYVAVVSRSNEPRTPNSEREPRSVSSST